MKITQEADYALRVVLYLSNLGYGKKVEAKVMSDAEKIPLRFLLKLLRKLIKADIIKSYRGKSGGYSLNKHPKSITLKDVVEAIDGPICINRCLKDPSLCNANKHGKCMVHNALCKIQKVIEEEFEKVTFEDIITQNKAL